MNEITKHDQGRFCWIDLATTNPSDAKNFYTELFNWEVNETPMGEGKYYSMLRLGGFEVAALYELDEDQKSQNIPPFWMSYISVDNVSIVTAQVEGLGGKVITPPFDVFNSGRMSIIQDPTGATVALWQPKEHIGVKLAMEPNTLAWNELLTTDTKKAGEFYSNLLGYILDVQQMGSMEYTIFKAGDQMAGGMMAITEEMGPVPPNWGVYFAVSDCDKFVEKAKLSGAQILVPPTDIPNVGRRFSTLQDPQGAVFSVIAFEEQS